MNISIFTSFASLFHWRDFFSYRLPALSIKRTNLLLLCQLLEFFLFSFCIVYLFFFLVQSCFCVVKFIIFSCSVDIMPHLFPLYVEVLYMFFSSNCIIKKNIYIYIFEPNEIYLSIKFEIFHSKSLPLFLTPAVE